MAIGSASVLCSGIFLGWGCSLNCQNFVLGYQRVKMCHQCYASVAVIPAVICSVAVVICVVLMLRILRAWKLVVDHKRTLKPIDILSQEERTAFAVDQPHDRARIMNIFDVWAGQAVLTQTHTRTHTRSSSDDVPLRVRAFN